MYKEIYADVCMSRLPDVMTVIQISQNEVVIQRNVHDL